MQTAITAVIVLAIVGLVPVLVLVSLLASGTLPRNRGAAGGGRQPRPAGPRTEATDRQIIVRQLHLGVGLIVFGSLLVAIYVIVFWLVQVNVSQAFGQGTSNTVLGTIAVSTATAVIGAGAALLPGGAATGAAYRILDSLSRASGIPVAMTGEATPDPNDPTKIILRGMIEPKGRVVAYRFVFGPNRTTTPWQWPGDPQAPVPAGMQAQATIEAAALNRGETYQLVAQADGQQYAGDSREYR